MEVDQCALSILRAYGFEEAISIKALLASNNSIDKALEWLSDHMYDV